MTLTEIKSVVETLNHEQWKELRDWMDQNDLDDFERKVSADANAGRLDAILMQVRKEIEDGHTTPLCK